MKRNTLLALALLCCSSAFAQDIQLPAPNLNRTTLSTMQALAQRQSVREYTTQSRSEQDLSDLLWATCGVSRDENHRTAPTAMNRREIRVYVINDKAAYEYLPVENRLAHIADGDFRKHVAGPQTFAATAPVCILLVGDFERFGSDNEHARLLVAMDAGIACENIYLYCASAGLATVTRAMMDVDALKAALHLTDRQVPLLNNPVGYPKP